MKRALARFGWPLAIALLVAGIYVWGKRRPLEVETGTVERGRIEEYVTEEAVTQLDVERVVAADFPGTARRITLEEGDSIAAGQLITTIEDTELQLSLEMMSAQVKEIEGRLAGVDVPLPKPSEIAAAEEEQRRAERQLAAVTEQKKAAEADLEYAGKELGRIEQLARSGSATARQLDLARRDLQTAQAALDAAAERLAAAEAAVRVAALRKQVLLDSMRDTAHLRQVYGAQIERLDRTMDLINYEVSRTRVTSPISGVVLEKHVDSERYVQQGTPLLTVGQMDSIEVRADILSDEVGRVRPGQDVLLVGKAVAPADVRGAVKKIYPSGFTKISSLGVRQQRVAVLVDFDNSRLGLKPGSELDVKIVVAARDDAVLVPTEAVFATAEGAAVFVMEGGRARKRAVTTGLTGEDHYEVTDGLSPGEVVLLRPPTDLKPGSRVKPAER
jgi:HlyD family secretion protein